MSKIVYTLTDEAPFLATHSFLPIVEAFAKSAGVEVVTRDISLAARILAQFRDTLTQGETLSDDLAELGELVLTPEANIMKLPNISASVPQLKEAILELRAQGYDLPDYPDRPESDAEHDALKRYNKAKGSAVNPVLREGNSDRRAPKPVKEFAKANPHRMGAWKSDSKSHVSTMSGGDFRANEKSTTLASDATLEIVHINQEGDERVLKSGIQGLQGMVVDATFMNVRMLKEFLAAQVDAARAEGILFSLHMKATMMKVSDPIIFGHAVNILIAPVLEEFSSELDTLEVNTRNGLGDLVEKVKELPSELRERIETKLTEVLNAGPDLAMVDSDNGITNFHVPSDVIIDASMPAMIRNSGQMWDKNGMSRDAKAVIPDSSYAGIYQATIDFCKEHGAFDPTTMGTIPNVGLMARKAEEYGSHDKTFEVSEAGSIVVRDNYGATRSEHQVEPGDIWRMCTVQEAAIRDWVRLAIRRSRESSTPVVFWLDKERPHDAEILKCVHNELSKHDVHDVEHHFMSPLAATQFSLERMKKGLDTISATGNVLRDYNTDLFPILEVGTSAKMLSIVPLMQGGGLFETGAGGSAPKHIDQLLKENHLRWDSLGEFLALAASLEHLGRNFDNPEALILGEALDTATTRYLKENKAPSRKCGEHDNRGSHFYLAMFWAEALAEHPDAGALSDKFKGVASSLREKENTINEELLRVQGSSVDIGGYYASDRKRTTEVMRPSATLNTIIDGI